MDRGAWRATVHGVVRVGHNLVTKPPPPEEMVQKKKKKKKTRVKSQVSPSKKAG